MTLDLDLLLKALGSVALLGIGALLNHLLERRPRLVAYYGSVGAFVVPPTKPGTPDLGVNTHTVVVRNAGRLAAHNVRVPHNGPLEAANIHVSIFPPVVSNREMVQGNREIIVIPTLAPGQQVTLSYLYFPPITFNLINLPISSDEGMARQLDVLPTPRPPRWLLLTRAALVIVGVAALIYGLFLLGTWVLGEPG